MMVLRARWVLPMDRPPITDGAVAVDGDRIVAVGSWDEVRATVIGATRDLGAVVLLPGLINAHTHLDYTNLLGRVPFHGVFLDWLIGITEAKRKMTPEHYRAAVRQGLDLARAGGATTLANIASCPTVIGQVNTGGIRLVWCVELIDLRETRSPSQLVAEAVALTGVGGLSPHALYTASAALYRASVREARARGWVLTTHVAESQEEDDMFRRGMGPMYERYLRAGRDMTDCKRASPVQLLQQYGMLGPDCLAVHANCLTPLDVQLLADTQTTVVHCPMTHRFFNRPTPMLDALQQAGVNVCLGTDSLASAPGPEGLSLFAEMQELARIFPRIEPVRILEMVTMNPARALRQAARLGRLAPGAAADVIAVPLADNSSDPYETVVFNEQPVVFFMVNGRVWGE